MELAVLVGGAPEMAHYFRPHRVLGWNNEVNVMLQGFLKEKPAGLAILLGEVRKLAIETGIHFQTDFLRACPRQGFPLLRTIVLTKTRDV
jgi:hypothetical protein